MSTLTLERPQYMRQEEEIGTKWTDIEAEDVAAIELVKLVSVEGDRLEETIETRIRRLETGLHSFIQQVLASRLTPSDIEAMATLSKESLGNIVTIRSLAKKIQEASGKE